jgi:transcriptional regulator with XRE-family HTH domain
VNLDDAHIGRRVREVRTWRGLSVAAVAGLAGISAPYLSLIERGQRPVTKRALLESLAQALRVSPTELTGKPYPPTDAVSNETHAAMVAVENVLAGWWIGEIPDGPTRPWPAIQADLDRLTTILRPAADYANMATLLPGLIRELLALVSDGRYREPALVGLVTAYHAMTFLAYFHLGRSGLAILAAERMRHAAVELDDPTWLTLAAWVRAMALNGGNRTRQYELAVNAERDAAGLRAELRGMANLAAALAAAAQGDRDKAQTHLTEASVLAETLDADISPWANLYFGRTNVGIWHVAIAVELGDGARVAEIANGLRLGNIPPVRQTAFWIDYGRGLLSERTTRDRGIAALLTAEKIAPQRFRNDVFAREAVASLLHTARRDAGGRELRGLAWRMGIVRAGDSPGEWEDRR